MNTMRMAVLMLLVAIVGCDESADDLPLKSDAVAKTRSPAPRPAANSPAETKTPAGRREVAKAGVGKKGRDYKIWKPIGVLFRTKHKLTFISIEHDLKIYQALHNRFPKSWDEFEKEIIHNKYTLPELPEGDKYVFDSEKGQLMVEHPPK